MNKIALPLIPYPDELFYSILARTKEILGESSLKGFSELCFGSRDVIATIELPSHLNQFAQNILSFSMTADQILDRHTFLPYFGPFIPPERLHRLREDMKAANGPAVHMRAGIMASRIPALDHLRFCESCLSEDKKEYGECYWHRVHQLPGVLVCPIHRRPLSISLVSPRRGPRQEYLTVELAGGEKIGSTLDNLSISAEVLCAIASNSCELLSLPAEAYGFEEIRQKYLYRLFQRGLCSYGGRTKSSEKLVGELVGFFGEGLLQVLGCPVDNPSDNWLLRLLRKDCSCQHPLLHLLLMQFLGETPEGLFSLKIPTPFGDPPWPCLNAASEHFLSLRIQEVKIIQSQFTNGKPIGEFACECIFTYRRTGPDHAPEDRMRRDRIVSYGPIWNLKLGDLWSNPSISLRTIAKSLGVDVKTTKRQAYILGLTFPRLGPRLAKGPHMREHIASIEDKIPRFRYRRAWLNVQTGHPGESVTALRKSAPGVYSWLYRHDRVWLKGNYTWGSPKLSPPIHRVDWSKRDDVICDEIPSAVESILSVNGKPIRVTIAALERLIGQRNSLIRHRNRLPRTAHELSRVVETQEQFWARKIDWAIGVLSSRNNRPKAWQILRLAGVTRRKLNADGVTTLANAIRAQSVEEATIDEISHALLSGPLSR